jgi:hypothetical protein
MDNQAGCSAREDFGHDKNYKKYKRNLLDELEQLYDVVCSDGAARGYANCIPARLQSLRRLQKTNPTWHNKIMEEASVYKPLLETFPNWVDDKGAKQVELEARGQAGKITFFNTPFAQTAKQQAIFKAGASKIVAAPLEELMTEWHKEEDRLRNEVTHTHSNHN